VGEGDLRERLGREGSHVAWASCPCVCVTKVGGFNRSIQIMMPKLGNDAKGFNRINSVM
jgi:hypothetical protein